ncbi:MAG: NAD(P)H-dependent oxidoreductase [Actinomycetota bacterium]|nr:NAD(P)H-dependent oxidoreductase [Actinomycetota bacterium]
MQSQNGNEIRILALAGSFRSGSFNQALIRAAREMAPDHIRIGDLDLRTLPFYDGDLEAAGDPDEVAALKTAIAEAAALLVATPEYNGSIPAVLKNAIDWASRRTPDSPLSNKPVAVMGASPSPGGTRRAQAHLREILDRAGADVIGGPPLHLARAFEHVTDGRLMSEDAREAVRGIVAGLVDAVVRDTAESAGDAA